MATYLTLLILLMTSIVSAFTGNGTSRNKDLAVAIQEMQTATYFSFVLLINMYPADRIPRNVTFLMPNDRTLSDISLPEDAVYNFLLKHSIPSPLLFDHLERFPTGSMVPTSEPDFMLRIINNGRRNFYLNNVQIISPNICTAGSSIRCHGIKGVLMPVQPASNTSFPSPTCSPTSPKTVAAPASPKDPAAPASPKDPAAPASPKSIVAPANPSWSPPPPKHPLDQISITAPPPINLKIGSKKSDSSQLMVQGLLQSIIPCTILALVTFQI